MKNIRKIIVNNIEYYWTIKYDEIYGIISCYVGLIDHPNHRFRFSRGADNNHQKWIDNGIESQEQIQAITPSMVKQAIIYANKNLDWNNTQDSTLPYSSKWYQS